MQAMIRRMVQWTLAITILATLAIIISLTLQVGGKIHVPIHTFVAVSALDVAASVGWAVMVCTRHLVDSTDRRIRQRDEDIDRRIHAIVSSLTEVRLTVAEFATTVGEYGDQRAQAARLAAMQSLAEISALADADRSVTHIRRHTAP